MRKVGLILLALLPSSAAQAAEHLTGPEITALLADVSLFGEQNGAAVEQIFRASGQTFYLVNGASSFGTWEVRGNAYCSLWPPNPAWACYTVTRDGPDIAFTAKNGTVFLMHARR